MSRISDLRDATERGEPVDLGQVATLQALDVAVSDEEFVVAATSRQEAADVRLGEWIDNAQ